MLDTNGSCCQESSLHAQSPFPSPSRSFCQLMPSWPVLFKKLSPVQKFDPLSVVQGNLEGCHHGHRTLHPHEGVLRTIHGRGLSASKGRSHIRGACDCLCVLAGSMGHWLGHGGSQPFFPYQLQDGRVKRRMRGTWEQFRPPRPSRVRVPDRTDGRRCKHAGQGSRKQSQAPDALSLRSDPWLFFAGYVLHRHLGFALGNNFRTVATLNL